MNWGRVNHPWIIPLLRHSIRSSLRRELAGVWVRGEFPTGGAVLAPNHHSWWDGYLLAELAWALRQPCQILMTARQLSRFPFLQLVGARYPKHLRPVVRAAQAGAWVVIFPEGEIRPQGRVGHLHAGAAWAARQSGTALYPVAVRVAMRGSQQPEAFVRFGAACPPEALETALNDVLAALDADLAASDPDFPPAGYLRLVQGRGSRHDKVGLPSRMLARLAGMRSEGQ